MKAYIQLIISFAVILITIPLITYAQRRTARSSYSLDTVTILCEETGEVSAVPLKEYIIGAVFAQMPADFEQDALNAQAVLASTYIKRRAAAEAASPDRSLKGALISDDRSKYQAYFSKDEAKEVYGSGYEQAYKRISAAADIAAPLCLCFENEPIIVAFHGISAGFTESAKDVWGEDISYLTSVECAYDTALDICKSGCTVTPQEMAETLSPLYPEEKLTAESIDESISIAEKTPHGSVTKLRIGEGVYDSAGFCAALGLASSHFELRWNGREFDISVLGCGHLVGMSQYGANEMAKSGMSYEEILTYFFQGTKLEKL